jgi:putative tricarboxylic transport membrane protein
MAISRRHILGIAGALGVTAMVAGLPGTAAAWEPNKPIDFIIMAGKGGGADKMARLMQAIIEQEKLSSKPLVPVNKSGGSGAEALIAAKSASDPDHTIMVTLNSFFTTPLRQPKLGIDIMEFAPVGRMAEDTFLLWVHKDSGIKTFEEFLAKAKADGNKWVMGGTGKAQEDELLTEFLNNNFGLKIKYVPYKGGGEVAKQLAGKQLNSTVNNPSEALGFYESGDVVPILSFTAERLPLFPNVPTMKEKGKDFAYGMQRAVVGAPGMSADALKYYENLFSKVYKSAKWQAYRKKQSLFGDELNGDPLKAYWKEQVDRHRKMLVDMGAIK